MVVPEQVQQAMQGKGLEFDFQAVSVLFRLPLRHACGDDDVTEEAGGGTRGLRPSVFRGKRQHVGDLVFTAELPVEGAHAAVRDQRHAHIAPR